MDLQAVRTELAALAPSGWDAYDTLPGSAETPCIVVGLPELVGYDGTYTMARVTLPVYVITSPQFDADAESDLLSAVVSVANSYRAVSGSSFSSCKVARLTDFIPQTLGNVEGYSASIILELLIRL